MNDLPIDKTHTQEFELPDLEPELKRPVSHRAERTGAYVPFVAIAVVSVLAVLACAAYLTMQDPAGTVRKPPPSRFSPSSAPHLVAPVPSRKGHRAAPARPRRAQPVLPVPAKPNVKPRPMTSPSASASAHPVTHPPSPTPPVTPTSTATTGEETTP